MSTETTFAGVVRATLVSFTVEQTGRVWASWRTFDGQRHFSFPIDVPADHLKVGQTYDLVAVADETPRRRVAR